MCTKEQGKAMREHARKERGVKRKVLRLYLADGETLSSVAYKVYSDNDGHNEEYVKEPLTLKRLYIQRDSVTLQPLVYFNKRLHECKITWEG